ncbi:serine/threonine-protein kinase KIN2 [Pleurotus ostreatus]|uniref:Serine/threonine-protein kinase KIN2 n=1 Tax=Pleurotus ostreatus TaxID=5322 RepID=A0A8H7DUU9_PLEOS|nr:serine/threonine-protein kinase KIN2 [Pleurotus ostreatus]KAF7439669.1 serine/threonine-protein kinase KIN2 [Pleurotus ostreatus]
MLPPVQPVPSPTSPTFQTHPQPRASDAGLPVPLSPATMPSSPTQPMSPVASAAATIKLKQVQMQEVGVRPPTGTTNAGGTKTMPRAPPASTHRQSHSLRQRPKVLRGWSNMFGGGEHGEEGRNIPDGPRTANAKHQHHVNALSHSRPLTHAPTQLDSANPPFLPSSHNSPSPRTHDRLG